MKNGKLILTKENLAVADYDTLKMIYGNQEGSKEFFDLIDLLKDNASRTKQIQSCMISKTSTLLLVHSFKKKRKVITQVIQISLTKPDKLANSVLLMLATANPTDLWCNSFHLMLSPNCTSLNYNYTIEFNKEHNRYEVADVYEYGVIR